MARKTTEQFTRRSEFVQGLAEIYKPLVDDFRRSGLPLSVIKAEVRREMVKGLLESAKDDPRASPRVLLAQAEQVLIPAFLILFPEPKPENN